LLPHSVAQTPNLRPFSLGCLLRPRPNSLGQALLLWSSGPHSCFPLPTKASFALAVHFCACAPWRPLQVQGRRLFANPVLPETHLHPWRDKPFWPFPESFSHLPKPTSGGCFFRRPRQRAAFGFPKGINR